MVHKLDSSVDWDSMWNNVVSAKIFLTKFEQKLALIRTFISQMWFLLCKKTISFWGPRPTTGASPLDPTGGLPSPRPPQCGVQKIPYIILWAVRVLYSLVRLLTDCGVGNSTRETRTSRRHLGASMQTSSSSSSSSRPVMHHCQPSTSLGCNNARHYQAPNPFHCSRGLRLVCSLYIQRIYWIPSKSRLWLYFNVYRKSDLWRDIYDAILLFFVWKQIATFWAKYVYY